MIINTPRPLDRKNITTYNYMEVKKKKKKKSFAASQLLCCFFYVSQPCEEPL